MRYRLSRKRKMALSIFQPSGPCSRMTAERRRQRWRGIRIIFCRHVIEKLNIGFEASPLAWQRHRRPGRVAALFPASS